MNVFAYISFVTLVGLVVAYFFGRAMSRLSGIGATFSFLGASVALGVILTVPVLMSVAKLCFFLGVTEEQNCIHTDQQTVWFLATPLILFPAYAIVMFVARAVAKQNVPDGKSPVA